MKRILSILTIAAVAAAFTLPASAAKPGKKKGKKGGDVVAMYDKNASGTIDGAEIDELKKDFTAGKAEAKALDTNNDGTLSDQEVAAASAKKRGKKKK